MSQPTTRPSAGPLCLTVFANCSRIPSMDRYARELASVLSSRFRVTLAGMEGKQRHAGYAERFLRYPIAAWRSRAQVNIMCSEGYAYLALVCGLRRSIVVWHDTHVLLDPATPRFSRMLYWINIAIARRCRAIVAVSAATAEEIRRIRGFEHADIRIIHNGICAGWHPRPGAEPDPFILSIGSDSWYKNNRATIAALYRIRQEVPIRLRRVGRFSAGEWDMIRSLGLEDAIVQESGISDERLAELYSSAALLLFPSWREGFGWPPVEAMACGCPVVAAASPGVCETCGDACLYASPDDPAGLAAAALAILRDVELAGRLRTLGLARAAELSLEHTGEKMATLVDEVVGDGALAARSRRA